MQSAPARVRRGLAVVAAVLALTAASVSLPATAGATTPSSMESALRLWINNDRAAHGLRGLRIDSRLNLLADQRAGWMATKGLLSHQSVDGDACQAMTKRAIGWYRCGEDIGFTTATWGTQSARFIYNLWKHSPPHWALLLSSRYNYLGVGFARRSNGTTYASLVFLEGPDRTRPIAHMRTKSVSGTTVRFSWSASDPLLQTHTAGIRNYTVQLRVDSGPYVTIRTNTTSRSLRLLHRAHGHNYTVRVQARDRRGNLSAWSSGLRARVP
jgi:uncharacterized protein YkwD